MRIVTLLAAFYCTMAAVSAENILFVGNSFTFGAGDSVVHADGGLPKLVEGIAVSKGKKAATMMVAAGGKNWAYHLANPLTDVGLKAKPWNWVVLQDLSSEPTHAGNVAGFMKDGRAFSDRIAKESPGAGIVLFSTWALGSKNKVYATKPTPLQFHTPDEMAGELRKNYEALAVVLRQADPHREVRVAEVGQAFALCEKKYPALNLFSNGDHHASREGSYLAALVIYATIFHDSPMGATWTFPGLTLDAGDVAKLQGVAQEVYLVKGATP
jgi:hypothetical protein